MRSNSPSATYSNQRRYPSHINWLLRLVMEVLFRSRIAIPVFVIIWFAIFVVVRKDNNASLRGSNGKMDASFFDAIDRYQQSNAAKTLSHLVVVAGHAVLRLSKLSVAQERDEGWYLLNYQKNMGFPEVIVSHIQKGLDLVRSDPNALLIFSGGQTRKDVGPLSEGASYYFLAEQNKWMENGLKNRVFLEEYARDSFENLLFALCRFHEVTGSYPQHISVIGFDFKEKRFTNYHRRAIGYPMGNFSYIGLHPTHHNWNQEGAVRGEQNAVESFSKDLYGCTDPSLLGKRDLRNPFKRTVPYELICPSMKDLLHWCGPGLFDVYTLPWAVSETSPEH